MLTVDQLIEESRDPRLQRLPQYAQNLIWDLAHRLAAEHAAADGARATAEREVAEARALLTEGPVDSDTFMDLPRSRYDDSEDQRPLGKGTNIEFRGPDTESGEGISVKWKGDHLLVNGINHLAVVPVDSMTIKIEVR